MAEAHTPTRTDPSRRGLQRLAAFVETHDEVLAVAASPAIAVALAFALGWL